jgi:hypothetical protein
MTSFPGSPRLVKGGIVLIDGRTGAVQRILALQYNPDTLTRSLHVKGAGSDDGDHMEALRLKGPPVETIKVEAEVDATDLLEAGDGQAARSGLHSALAALEIVLYPSSSQLLANNAQASSGSLEITPVQAALTVFVFGAGRIVPVRITELSITEEAFDPALNPIRAKLELTLRVLSTDDLGFDRRGGLFLTYLRAKERFASEAAAGTFGTLGVTGVTGVG